MKTKINEINTAAELITYTTAFGIPTDTESICRMQDIIGHTAVDDLVKLATDDGTETDGNGSRWTTGRRGTKTQTMNILFHIWHWEDATRFYNRYVNQEVINTKEQLQEVTQDAITWKETAETYKEAYEKYEGIAGTNYRNYIEAKQEATEQKQRADELEKEMLKLKAMLFDYMTKGA